MPCIMPARLAETDPFKQVTEMVGSGPFKFVAAERVAGHHVVYEKFAGYVPRPNGKSSFLAGPKVVHYDRVEWVVIPDTATTAAALQSGEIDMWENVVSDFLPVLKADRNIQVGSNKMLTAIGFMRFNHLYPPFDNPEVRRALLSAVDQATAMQAVTGTDPELWSDKIGLFGPQMPLHTSVGTEVMTAPRDFGRAKQALEAAGYKGEPILLMDPADVPELHALNSVGIDVLRRAGLNVDVAALDFGTVVRRRVNAEPPDKGGWNVYCTFVDGAYAFIPPNVLPLTGNGRAGYPGWSTSPRIEALLKDWYDAPDLTREKQVVDDLQRQLWIDVPYIPMGQYQQQMGWRRTVTDIPVGFPLFYGIRPA
jgi:peptide/nickel transport system substrate-binding protein